ncbi:hypothetical protein, unlikely [Trypanosoma congolense IL3000]|uniref:Uncharacterized protein n=1 Tax=Trypanosoma congolense (strain IL3000) TaxID=1068625 RepID=F9WDG5_TRYCI|nr:hypothetical protein, unlikely [Trypanosoma congolense IL3000]
MLEILLIASVDDNFTIMITIVIYIYYIYISYVLKGFVFVYFYFLIFFAGMSACNLVTFSNSRSIVFFIFNSGSLKFLVFSAVNFYYLCWCSSRVIVCVCVFVVNNFPSRLRWPLIFVSDACA